MFIVKVKNKGIDVKKSNIKNFSTNKVKVKVYVDYESKKERNSIHKVLM